MTIHHDLLVTVTNIGVRFGSRWVLKEVNLSVKRGELVSLIGPNGAGKTTLVRVVLGLIRPTTGQVMRESLRIGYMPQQLQINQSMPLTAMGFLQLAGRFSQDDIRTALRLANVEQVITRPLYHLSGGETQRVLLARALLRKPDLLVLDEPAQGVDITGQVELYQTIAQIRHQLRCGVLMISHDLHLVMASTDTVYCLNQHICCQGRPESVSQDPAYVALFGTMGTQGLALYRHAHDHQHLSSGDIAQDKAQLNQESPSHDD